MGFSSSKTSQWRAIAQLILCGLRKAALPLLRERRRDHARRAGRRIHHGSESRRGRRYDDRRRQLTFGAGEKTRGATFSRYSSALPGNSMHSGACD